MNSPAKRLQSFEETLPNMTPEELEEEKCRTQVNIDYLDKKLCRIHEQIAKQKEGR